MHGTVSLKKKDFNVKKQEILSDFNETRNFSTDFFEKNIIKISFHEKPSCSIRRDVQTDMMKQRALYSEFCEGV